MTELYFVASAAVINGRRKEWLVDRDMDRAGRGNTLDDILTGQVENVIAVYSGDLDGGRFRDASLEFVEELLTLAIDLYGFDDDGELAAPCRDFIALHNHDALIEAEDEYGSALSDYDEHHTLSHERVL